MSKTNIPALTEEEIEEELINNDLMNSGGVENQETLLQMNLEEKKDLLRCIKQSKESFHNKTGMSSKVLKKPIIIDTSSPEFPALTPPSKGSVNKLKLPRKPCTSPKTESQDQCISLLDDDNDLFIVKPKKFSLPFCVSDNAPPLPQPDRAVRREECPYYQMKGEMARDALRRMLAHHDMWKEKYNSDLRKLESRGLIENIQDDNLDKKSENGDSENDPYTFTEKVNSTPGVKKRDINKGLNNSASQNSRPIQRRTSRDSDCEEIQTTPKPEEAKLGEWLTAARPRSKRNRKQNSNQARVQSLPEVEFEFDNSRSLWDAGRSGGSPQSPAPARRTTPKTRVPEVPEEKVQCPICQRNFTISTVENHAATCEGFSSSPMDVEEGS